MASLSVGSSSSQSSVVTLLACNLVRVVITVAIVATVAIIISSVTPLSLSSAAHENEDSEEHEEGQQVPTWFFTRVIHLFVYLPGIDIWQGAFLDSKHQKPRIAEQKLEENEMVRHDFVRLVNDMVEVERIAKQVVAGRNVIAEDLLFSLAQPWLSTLLPDSVR